MVDYSVESMAEWMDGLLAVQNCFYEEESEDMGL